LVARVIPSAIIPRSSFDMKCPEPGAWLVRDDRDSVSKAEPATREEFLARLGISRTGRRNTEAARQPTGRTLSARASPPRPLPDCPVDLAMAREWNYGCEAQGLGLYRAGTHP